MIRIIVLMLFMAISVASTQAPAEFFAVHGFQDLSAVPLEDVTLPEVITILADYDFVHEGRVLTHNQYFGLTDPGSRTIFINSRPDETTRKLTVIHEILHVIYARRGYMPVGPLWEQRITTQEREIYSRLYSPIQK